MAVNITLGCIHQLKDLNVAAYIFGLVNLIIVMQNILTIVTIYRTVALHTITNMILVSMNIGNTFLPACFLVITAVFYTGLINDTIYVDVFGLGLFAYAEVLNCFHYGGVAIDRYIYISQPFVYIRHVTRSCVIKVIIGCWLVAIIYLCLPLIVYRSDSYHETCILEHYPVEYLSAIWFVYLSILIIVFICDFKIVRLAFRRKKAAIERRIATSSDNSLSENNFKAAIKSVKFFAINFGIFSVCTLPLGFFAMVKHFMTVSNYVRTPVVCMYEFNQIVGFYVHMYTCKEFYKGLKKLFRY